MKAAIHPTEYKEVVISCVCGAQIATATTVEGFSVEICSSCHPFYTGTQKIVDTQGRVERFKNRYAKKEK